MLSARFHQLYIRRTVGCKFVMLALAFHAALLLAGIFLSLQKKKLFSLFAKLVMTSRKENFRQENFHLLSFFFPPLLRRFEIFANKPEELRHCGSDEKNSNWITFTKAKFVLIFCYQKSGEKSLNYRQSLILWLSAFWWDSFCALRSAFSPR